MKKGEYMAAKCNGLKCEISMALATGPAQCSGCRGPFSESKEAGGWSW